MSDLTLISRLLALCAVLLMLAGCGSTELQDAWQAPGFRSSAMKQVLVVGVTSDKTKRILFERAFVKSLGSHGMQATASYDAIGDRLPKRESVDAWLAQHPEITHVMVTRHGGNEVTKEYVPESVRTYYTGPYYPSYGGYWGRYGNEVTMVREPYVDTKTKVILSTSIYDVHSQELVWVGRSKSFEVGSITHSATELAEKIIRRIR